MSIHEDMYIYLETQEVCLGFVLFHYVCNYYTVLFVFFAEYVNLWLLLQQIAWSSVQIIKSTKPRFFAVLNSGKLKYF